MTEAAAIAFAYGVVGVVLVVYVMRLWRRVQRMDMAHRDTGSSGRTVPDR